METLETIIARHAIPVVPVVYLPAPQAKCYGCDAVLDGDRYREEYCSHKCFCEVSCIDRENG